jgi:hypothetical protein
VIFTQTSRHLILALLLAAAIVIPRAILIQRAHSETSDDDYHLVRGLEFLHRDAGLVHRELNDPPLGEALAALPLWVMGGTTHGQVEGTAIYGQKNYSPETAMMAIAIWKAVLFLPLVAVVFLWCTRLYGAASGWLGVVLLLIEPTITGHLHLAALDVIGTTAIVIACFLGWRYFERPGNSRLASAALGCAAALLIKHTAVLVPLIFCGYGLIIVVRGRKRGCGDGSLETQDMPTPAEAVSAVDGNYSGAWHQGVLPLEMLKGFLITLLAMWALLAFDMSPARKGGAIPGGLYIQSLQDAARHVAEPNDAYLLGQVRRGGWWYYFPVVATYKVPIGIAAVILLGLLSYFNRKLEWREGWLLLPLIGYVVFLMLQSINIGWRHFLPAYVFMLMLGTRSLAPGVSGRIVPWIAVAAVAISTTLRWHPDYLAYVTWPRKDAALAISDSNLDWGQGLKEVRRWIDENQHIIGGRKVYFRGFAVKDRAVAYYLGDRAVNLHFSDRPPDSGILILSPVCLAGVSESKDEYAFLRGRKPMMLIGHTLRVYDLDHPSP